MLLLLIQHLLEGYGLDDRITTLVDSTRIHIMPTMNPDGFEIAHEGDRQGYTGRNNANNQDLNRNFPDQFRSNTPKAEPEVEAVMKWSREYPFVLSANLHGGSLVANYPFDSNQEGREVYSPSSDDAVFKSLALAYSHAHKKMHLGLPCPREREHFRDGITNGAQWYVLNGGMQDWNYLHTNDFEITLELGCYKYPPHAQLAQYWQDNREALLAFIERVHTGIKGFVLSEEDPPAVITATNATIEVDEIKHPISSTPYGDYFRLLVPGKSYTVSAVAEGYERSVISQVYVPNALMDPSNPKLLSAKVVNFTLAPDRSGPWSEKYDYDLEDNLATVYLSNDQMRATMADLENQYPDLLETKMNEAEWNVQVPALYIRNDTDGQKINIALFGSVYGAQPVGRELLVRLARHICQGYVKRDPQWIQLLNHANLYLFPMVDYDYFDPANQGDCGYDMEESMNHELGSKFRRAEAPYYKRAQPAKAAAIEFFLQTHNISVALSLEGEGIFTRLPYDSDTVAYKRLLHQSAVDNLMVLAQAYSQNRASEHDGKCDSQKPTGILTGSQLNGRYRGSLLDYAFAQGTDIISAHVTCCNFPHGRELPYLWRANLPALQSFLAAATQGIYGRVYGQNGQVLSQVALTIDDKPTEIRANGLFLALLPKPGDHQLSFKLNGYQSKQVEVKLKAGEMARQNVILDPIEESDHQEYHTPDQIGMLINQLTVTYAGKARVYPIGETAGRSPLLVIQVSDSLESAHLKPAVKVNYLENIYYFFD